MGELKRISGFAITTVFFILNSKRRPKLGYYNAGSDGLKTFWYMDQQDRPAGATPVDATRDRPLAVFDVFFSVRYF